LGREKQVQSGAELGVRKISAFTADAKIVEINGKHSKLTADP
jgi:hypothetical protein